MKKLPPTPIQPLCCAVPDLTPQTKEITMGQIKKENPPQMSCCYGIMVFLGLFASLLTLTLLVIYAGVWTQRSLYGKINLNNPEWIPYFRKKFPPLNSFLPLIVSAAKIQFIRWKIEICDNYFNFLQFPNSKKNSLRKVFSEIR